MALFRVYRGLAESLPTVIRPGYCYITTDDGKFYVDTDNGRICINQIPDDLGDLNDDSTHRLVTDAQITQWNAAEPNQNAFSNVTVGNTTLAADSKTDTLTFIGGTNITIEPNESNDSVTISAVDTQYSLSVSGNTIVLTPSSGSPDTITVPYATVAGTAQTMDAANLTGTIDIERIPAAALERVVTVADDTARFALTTDDVQVGDTVKVTSTNLMYMVKDTSHLDSAAGYEEYYAGNAASVPWSGVTGKPSTYTPSTHTHVIADVTDLESKTASQGGTDLSLVTTGEKYTWEHNVAYEVLPSEQGGTDESLVTTGEKYIWDNQAISCFGTSTTAANTAQKDVTILTGLFALEAGTKISVKFANANTADTPTLKVGTAAAKNIYHNDTQITTNDDKYLLLGACDFIYDGTQWHLVGSNIQYINASFYQDVIDFDIIGGAPQPNFYSIVGSKADLLSPAFTGSPTAPTAALGPNTTQIATTAFVQDEAEAILGNFATVEESTTASQAYKVGEYLILNGLLYRVTTAIAADDTIAVGTNVTQTTVGDEMANNILYFASQAVSAASTAADICTITDSRITADHVVTECVWASPSNITTDVSWTTSAGQLVLNGECSAATTVNITLAKKAN